MGLLSNPVIAGLLSGGPNAVRAREQQRLAAMLPRGQGGMMGAPSGVVRQDSGLGAGLAGLGEGLSAIGEMRAQQQAQEQSALAKKRADNLLAGNTPDGTAFDPRNPNHFAIVTAAYGPDAASKIAAAPSAGYKEVNGQLVDISAQGGPIVRGDYRSPTATTLGSFDPRTASHTVDPNVVRANEQLRAAGRPQTNISVNNAPTGADGNPGLQSPNVDREPLGQRLGVPVLNGNPYAGLTEGQADEAFSQNLKTYNAEREAIRENLAQTGQLLPSMKRFAQLNRQVPTGKADDVLIPDALKPLYASSEYSEMMSLQAFITPKMREPGSGGTSDFEGRMFARANVNVERPYEANANIVKAWEALEQRNSEKLAFLESYWAVNRTTDGAEDAWRRYMNDNPIFDPSINPDEPGEFTLNESRVPWKEYFRGGGSMPKEPKKFTATNPAQPATQSDYEKLPSGSYYVHPKFGDVRRKK